MKRALLTLIIAAVAFACGGFSGWWWERSRCNNQRANDVLLSMSAEIRTGLFYYDAIETGKLVDVRRDISATLKVDKMLLEGLLSMSPELPNAKEGRRALRDLNSFLAKYAQKTR